jgi:large subunit ribosomal protein L29
MMAEEDIRNLSTGEIQVRLNDAREELMRLRFQLSTGELTDYTRLRFTRRKIARMLTILREQQLAASMEAEQ